MASKYTPDKGAILIELMSDGKSAVQVAKEFGISRNTLDNWAKEYPEFKEAYTQGKTAFEAYMVDMGMKGAKGILAKFNFPAWAKLISACCRGDWIESSKIELEKPVVNKSLKEIDEEIGMLLAARKLKVVDDSENK